MSIFDLVYSFVEVARDLQKEYVEAWLKGEVKDYDMDMALINERQARSGSYKKLANEIQSRHPVE